MKKNRLGNPYKIRKPHSREEFHENLEEYYICIYGMEDVCEGLYVKDGVNSPQIIPLDQIRNINQLYETMSQPMILPKVTLNNPYSGLDFWGKKKNYTLWDDQILPFMNNNEFLSKGKPMWIGLNNGLYRDFFVLTLGLYSGYNYIHEEHMKKAS